MFTERQRELLDQPVVAIGLSTRTTNTLENAGVLTVRDLLNCCPKLKCECGRKHVLGFMNFGARALEEVFARLSAHGIERRVEKPKKLKAKKGGRGNEVKPGGGAHQ